LRFCHIGCEPPPADLRRLQGRRCGSADRSSRLRVVALALLLPALLLAGCHGSTLDAIYPGSLGHQPPPAINLPPQDHGLERL
jgi:hypothetical protein